MTTNEFNPPRFAEATLRSLVRRSERDPISGDLLEEYREARRPALGAFRANAWYITQVLSILGRLSWPCLLAMTAITLMSLNFKTLWYGSVLPLPLVSLADATINLWSGYYASQRTGLIRTGAIVGGATSVTGFAILFTCWAIANPSLLLAPFAKPFIFVILAVMLFVAAGYGVLAGAIGGVAARWLPPTGSQRSRVP